MREGEYVIRNVSKHRKICLSAMKLFRKIIENTLFDLKKKIFKISQIFGFYNPLKTSVILYILSPFPDFFSKYKVYWNTQEREEREKEYFQ